MTGSLVSNASLVTKVYFPRVAAPLSALLPGLIDLAVALASLTVLLVVVGETARPGHPDRAVAGRWRSSSWWSGPGLLLATVNVRYRDVHHVFGFITQLWFFASPVAYPSTLVSRRPGATSTR